MTAPILDLPEDLNDAVALMAAQLGAEQKDLVRFEQYLTGTQPMAYMAPAMMAEVGDRIPQLAINWPELAVTAYENRLDVQDFRYAGEGTALANLREVWQANNLDEQSQLAHHDAIGLGRSIVIVGSPTEPDGLPVITVESPTQVTVRRNPANRKVTSAMKRWTESDKSEWAQLYRPYETTTCTLGKSGWEQVEVAKHGLEVPPVVVLANRPRTLQPNGTSEFGSIIALTDAANKMATDMMISGEFHAMPRRWAFGLTQDDFVDRNGNRKSTWSAIAGRLWSSSDKEVKVGQFPEADLVVFHNTIKMLAQVVCQLLALPPHYMSFTGDNPASADAIRSSESQLVKRVERKQTYFGGAWEDVMRLVMRIQDDVWDPKARSLETVWRDPSTPTIAQKADATVKLVQAGVMPIEMARMELGWTSPMIEMAAKMDQAAAARGMAAFTDAVRVGTGEDVPADPAAIPATV